MTTLRRNIPLLYAFSFLQMTLFPMAVITLFWKEHIGLSLSQILLLQSIFAVAMVMLCSKFQCDGCTAPGVEPSEIVETKA